MLMGWMEVEAEILGYILTLEGILYLDVEGGSEGILVGKQGRTLEAIEIFAHRIGHRLGERAKRDGKAMTVDLFNAKERKIIHRAL
jgi:predicted RNA-binding protein Jag